MVVTPTKTNGMMVTQAYFALPRLMIQVVPTARAMVARSWLAEPNMGQMVDTLPV